MFQTFSVQNSDLIEFDGETEKCLNFDGFSSANNKASIPKRLRDLLKYCPVYKTFCVKTKQRGKTSKLQSS